MGRKKISIMTIIPDDRLRQVTYCKRKKGLLKKAMELSILCGIQINMILQDVTHQKLVSYQSIKGEDLFINQAGNYPQIKEIYYNTDYEKVSFKKGDAKDEEEISNMSESEMLDKDPLSKVCSLEIRKQKQSPKTQSSSKNTSNLQNLKKEETKKSNNKKQSQKDLTSSPALKDQEQISPPKLKEIKKQESIKLTNSDRLEFKLEIIKQDQSPAQEQQSILGKRQQRPTTIQLESSPPRKQVNKEVASTSVFLNKALLDGLNKENPSPKEDFYDLDNLDDGHSSSSSIDGDNETQQDMKKKSSKKDRDSKSATTPANNTCSNQNGNKKSSSPAEKTSNTNMNALSASIIEARNQNNDSLFFPKLQQLTSQMQQQLTQQNTTQQQHNNSTNANSTTPTLPGSSSNTSDDDGWSKWRNNNPLARKLQQQSASPQNLGNAMLQGQRGFQKGNPIIHNSLLLNSANLSQREQFSSPTNFAQHQLRANGGGDSGFLIHPQLIIPMNSNNSLNELQNSFMYNGGFGMSNDNNFNRQASDQSLKTFTQLLGLDRRQTSRNNISHIGLGVNGTTTNSLGQLNNFTNNSQNHNNNGNQQDQDMMTGKDKNNDIEGDKKQSHQQSS
ncbi:mads-box transcription factor [Stylonychia lemnae]|uniref:Mads-box transcription factor n=1 Tax=Stylonychia lemnae TaxID=5949 RepID=A0A078B587_STYLE|nr:mads-box transcription factor [Stylonychia lemnae]|eukprot:CDW89690.1 mads-box transcription factor [Stylonychia lemnae]